LRDTGSAMSQENVDLVRRMYEGAPEIERLLADGEDLAGHPWLSLWHPDCVLRTSPSSETAASTAGPAAIRSFLGGWWDAFEEIALEPEDVLELGHGVVFTLVRQTARPANSTGRVQRREAYVVEWVEDMIRQVTVYTDIDEGRAAAERLAEEPR
jgi:ketosteroid isomerase-like protein